jgi:general secretion pathway protein L
MSIDTIGRRWIDILARLWLGWRDRRRARHWLKIRFDGECLVVRQGGGKDHAPSRRIPLGAAVSAELNRAAERSFVMLELSSDAFISRRMTVPAQARDLLPGIVRNQIERLSPWREAQALHGFDVGQGDDAGNLDVRILLAPRAIVEEVRAEAATLGLRVDAVVASTRAADSPTDLTLWSRLDNANDDKLSRVRWVMGGLMAATVGLTILANVWIFIAAATADGESEDLGKQITVLQRQIRGAYSAQTIAALAPPERAWALKETSSVAAIVLEALSRALPDSAYLTELSVDGSTLRIAGVAQDAPALIAPLEQSGQFREVHFHAPTTRSADGARFIFHIEARVEPHASLGGG